MYLCAGCGENVPASVKEEGSRRRTPNIHVDHTSPVVDVELGWVSWDDCIEKMFSELDNLQLLCSNCHREKTAEETAARKMARAYCTDYPKEYNSWKAMRARCLFEHHHAYDKYGGRGITICDKWLSFKGFLEDMGERPEGTTLDRLDNSEGYNRENCSWRTAKQQARNRTNNSFITAEGETKCIAEWSQETGLPVSTINGRVLRGKTPEECVSTQYDRGVRSSGIPIEELIQAFDEGASYKELGERFGYNPDTIRKALYKVGKSVIKRAKEKLADEK